MSFYSYKRLGLFIWREIFSCLLWHLVAGFGVHSLLTAGEDEAQDINPCRYETVIGCLIVFFIDNRHGVILFFPFFCCQRNVFKQSHTVDFVENSQKPLKNIRIVYISIYAYMCNKFTIHVLWHFYLECLNIEQLSCLTIPWPGFT